MLREDYIKKKEESTNNYTQFFSQISEEDKGISKKLSLTNLIGNWLVQKKEGWLIINLKRPREIRIKSASESKLHLTSVYGEIKLKLLHPVILEITPPPSSSDQITWRGGGYTPKRSNTGIYRLDDVLTNISAP